MEKDFSKLGGWLIFFIVSCGITIFQTINTFFSLSEVFAVFSDLGGQLATIATFLKLSLIFLLCGSICGILAVFMRKRKLLLGFYIPVLLSVVLSFATLRMYPDDIAEALSSSTTSAVFTCVRDFIVLVAWFAYFKSSNRAREYFEEAEY